MSNPEFEDITIRDSMIRLGQLLKLANLVEDGVEAAELIKNGLVKVPRPPSRPPGAASRRPRPRRAYFLALSTTCVRNSETWPISCWLMPCHMPV